MKYVAWLMVLLLLATVGGVGYLYMTANITVESITFYSQAALEQQALFDGLQQRSDNDTVLGTIFDHNPIGAVEDYALYTYTLHLINDSMLQADMIEIQVIPMDGDIVQVGDSWPRSLSSRSEGDISATILTKSGTHAVRELIVTYYIWGVPFQVKVTYG